MVNLTLQTDRDANGSYETVEHIDHFTVDANGHADVQPTYDPAGNLTYDGSLVYTYDAWNRLVKVTKAYRDPTSGNVTLGSVIAEHEYDGLHRRIVRQVKNSADLDGTFHDYYDGQSVIETRNGSDLVLKQQVWGVTYIDELVQIAVNGDPVDDPEFDPADADHDAAYYYAVHNANYNVQLVVDATGDTVERYEYAPYGERAVYISPGSNDPDCHAPTLLPQRVKVAGTAQPYAICEFGHQGLMHDDASGLIYNRARMLHSRFQRFMQWDPGKKGLFSWNRTDQYRDGMNLYQYVRSMPTTTVDPTGTVAGLTPRVYSTPSGCGTFDVIAKSVTARAGSITGPGFEVKFNAGTCCGTNRKVSLHQVIEANVANYEFGFDYVRGDTKLKHLGQAYIDDHKKERGNDQPGYLAPAYSQWDSTSTDSTTYFDIPGYGQGDIDFTIVVCAICSAHPKFDTKCGLQCCVEFKWQHKLRETGNKLIGGGKKLPCTPAPPLLWSKALDKWESP